MSSSASLSPSDSSSGSGFELPVKKIRNVGIIAHIDADVDKGSTVTDYLPSERERGITITSACIPLAWSNHRINLIDTPGHIDFTIEVERSLRVLDGAVVILDGVAGVEAQTETVWHQANRNGAASTQTGIPRVIFVNKMDREGAGLIKCVKGVYGRLRGWGEPLIVHWPVVMDGTSSLNGKGSGGPGFEGIVDLVTMQVVDYDSHETGSIERRRSFRNGVVEGGSDNWSEKEIGRLWKEVVEARTQLVERLSALDDAVVESFLDHDAEHLSVPPDVLKESLRRLTLQGKVVPLLCGAAFRNVGVQPVLDAVVEYLPSPLDRPPALGRFGGEDGAKEVVVGVEEQKTCALAFKVIHDDKRGALVFVRVYSGVIEGKALLYNSSRQSKEKVSKILQMYADDFEEIPKVTAGNIACL
ncbi:Ribosome-releasing factor 2, mitochondrial, partial [Dinochytrium kinnereticum]